MNRRRLQLDDAFESTTTPLNRRRLQLDDASSSTTPPAGRRLPLDDASSSTTPPARRRLKRDDASSSTTPPAGRRLPLDDASSSTTPQARRRLKLDDISFRNRLLQIARMCWKLTLYHILLITLLCHRSGYGTVTLLYSKLAMSYFYEKGTLILPSIDNMPQ